MKKMLFTILALLSGLLILSVSGCRNNPSQTQPTPPPPPAAPAYITVTPADSQLTVEWLAVYDATGYEVWYGTENDTSKAAQVTQKFTGTTCIITGLTNGTTYYVWVRAKNSGGTSDWSSVRTGKPVSAVTPPDAPNAPALKGGNTEITVIWNSVAGATGYEVWYSTTNDTSSAIKSTNLITGTGTTITGLTNGTTYYVWVKAVNSEGTSGFSPGAQITLEIIYNGSIRGFVTSSGSYSVILVEQSKIQTFYTPNQYFYFNNLAPGTYHVRIERPGYEGILKEVYLGTDAIVELGTFNIDETPLPDGNGYMSNSIKVSMDNVQSTSDFSKEFTIPQHAISATLTYFIKPIPNITTVINGKFERKNPSPYVYFSRTATTSALSGTVNFTDLMAGTYHIIIYCVQNDGSYLNLVWKIDNGKPKISMSKTWGNSTDVHEIYVSCSDLSGIRSAQYYISKTTIKPTNFNDMMANYNVQITDKGLWYLHVQATDNENNVSYRCAGPFIIQ